jgi:hypothetical protein
VAELPVQSVLIDPSIGVVEIKVTAHVLDEAKVLALLAERGEEPQARTVYFFDTPDLTLFEAGLVLRARKVDGDDDDSTVKLRPVEPRSLGDWLTADGFEVEMDRVGEREVVSAKLSTVARRGEIDDVVRGRRALRTLFSQVQEQLIADFGPAEVAWDHLTVMGPIEVQKWTAGARLLEEDVVVERWRLPNGSDLIEMSTKAPPERATETAEAFRGLLVGLGLEVDGDQQTKTRGALSYFTGGAGFA